MDILRVKDGQGQWRDIPAIVGPQGRQGSPGQDGISPSITVTDIAGGHRVTITDAEGQHSFDVMNGEDAVKDVQVNGVSVLSDGVANVPVVQAHGQIGAVRINLRGLTYLNDPYDSSKPKVLGIDGISISDCKTGSSYWKVAIPAYEGAFTFYGLAAAAGSRENNSTLPVGQYTESAKSAISTMLNGPVTVSGTTPSITALPGIQYVCGEVATLDITLPASGCVDVVFTSGSTPTVLTITPPTGVTVKWANGFDPTALEANTTYEINIKDGLGVAASWT